MPWLLRTLKLGAHPGGAEAEACHRRGRPLKEVPRLRQERLQPRHLSEQVSVSDRHMCLCFSKQGPMWCRKD